MPHLPATPSSRPAHPAGPAHSVRRARPLGLLAALLLAGPVAACGSVGDSSAAGSATSSPTVDASSTSTPTASGGDCPADTASPSGPSAQVDVDGDGTPERVGLVSSPCGTALGARSGGRTWGVELDAQDQPVQDVFGVRVPGRGAELVVTRSTHPRGGEQLRVYAAQGDRLVELRRGTEPLVPFTATDVQEQPAAVSCGQGSLVLTVAVAHQPPGVLAAWDVRRTTYNLPSGGGARLSAGATREVADNVLPAQLRREWPDLVAHRSFAGCRVG